MLIRRSAAGFASACFAFAALVLPFKGAFASRPRHEEADGIRKVRLTLLHTNDTHGHLLPYSYPETYNATDPVALLKSRHDIGGAARRATLVNRVRQEKDHATLLVDAGDICDGTPFSTEYHGDADIAVMNALGYDVACPGNHEYSNALPQVRKLIAQAKFPLISSNSTLKADGKLLYQPYVIKEVGGAKIAFLGLLTYDARTYNAAKTDLVMEEPIETAKRLVPQLRKQANLVVVVSHIGVDEDIKLAALVPGIDVIVGGHSHTLLPAPLLVPHPGDLSPHSVHGTVIVQDFQWAGTLGRLDLTLHNDADGAWHVAQYKGRLLPVTSSTPEDPSVASVVARYWDPIKGKYGEVIGCAAGDFASKGPDHAEYNLIADAVRERMGVDFEIENMGGVRSPLTKGPFTYADMINMDPFGNTIVTFRATGRQIKEMLAKERPAVSGIRYTYTTDALTEATLGGSPIEDEKTYTGATNNYYARILLADIADKTDTGKPRLETVLAYIRARKSITPVYDGRRVLKGISDSD